MSKRRPRHHSKAHAKYYPGRRRGIGLLVERLSQRELVARSMRRLDRATAAVVRAQGERRELQERLAALRARLTVTVGEDTYVRSQLSRR